MYVDVRERDVACVYGWISWGEAPEAIYTRTRWPKIPLMLAALRADQTAQYGKIMLADGWRKVGWYPTCHDSLDKGFRMSLFCKEQDVPALKFRPDVVYRPFNEYVPLSCSCAAVKTRMKKTPRSDFHATLGLHRMRPNARNRTFNNWRRFAVTPLASYWYWGLAPDETNRRKYE